MNRVLFEQSEVDADGCICVTGRRAKHIINVLKPEIGDTLRVGVLDGSCGSGVVLGFDGNLVEIRCSLDEKKPEPPAVDLLLALPRPKVMKRLWAPLASLGAGRIILTNAEKVERNYFDTHWLDEDHYRPLLIEGLEQSGDTLLPRVEIQRQLKPFIEDKLESQFAGMRRLIGHPRNSHPVGALDWDNRRVLLAVGPEGGWSDYEIDLLARHGFECITLGWRTLRTDVACIAMMTAVQLGRRKSGKTKT